MTATKDTPLKRFTAFWVVLGLFALFGILAFIVGLSSKTPELTAADKAGAERRLAVRAEVDAAQAANLAYKEEGASVQAAPSQIFASFGKKLAASKPSAVKEDRHRDPSVPAEETPAADESASEAASAEAPVTSDSPA